MFRIAVLVSGGGTNLQAIIDSIESGRLKNVEISIVVSSDKNAFALKRAEKHGIASVVIQKSDFMDISCYEDRLIEIIKEKNINLVVLAGFMTILSEKFILAYEGKIINIHPSLIPAFCGNGYYGLNVHRAAINKGVKITGATVHFVNRLADDGPIILQEAVPVLQDDTPEVLQKRVMEYAEWIILPKAIELISQNKLITIDNIVKCREVD